MVTTQYSELALVDSNDKPLNQNLDEKKSNKGMVFDVLQQYILLSAQAVAFPNLPANMQVPDANNSVDLREYAGELMQYYRDDNGAAMGKILFNMLPMYKDQYATADASSANAEMAMDAAVAE